MLTRRARRQLLAFVLISLLGTAYVGARYARLDRLVLDTTYEVTAQLTQSGGIFTGAEVSYRGVRVGTVSDMRLTRDGVDVILGIDNSSPPIPADTVAAVLDKSAVGEQYVDLEPRSDGGPFLRDGSVITHRDTTTPVSTTRILSSADQLVRSVPEDALRTTVSEMGTAFQGTGDDLARMIDSSDDFLRTAADDLDVTTDLITDSNTVLRTQAGKGSAIRSFARDLALFTGTIADHDQALRTLIDNGSATATELQAFLDDNGVDLGQLINNLVTTGEVVVKRLPAIRQVLVLYPYAISAGYTVVVRGPGGYQTRTGLILNALPALCHDGYDPAQQRPPTDLSDRPMDEDAHCAEPPTKSNPRGSQNAPRTAPSLDRTRPVATYDVGTGQLSWIAPTPSSDGLAPRDRSSSDALGELLLQPLG